MNALPLAETAHGPRLAAEGVTLSYEGRVVSRDLSTEIPPGSFTVIIGPNACGKSTLLKSFARTLRPEAGRVTLDGRALGDFRPKDLARRLALLPQSPLVPDGITVRDLVGRGRFPHQTLLKQWSREDEEAVTHALHATGAQDLVDRQVSELSGGQRQRVWVSLVLAQQTDLLLLDEPTTFLDIAHQFDLLEICARLNREGRTIVAVLHDLNQAARYATHLVVMKSGEIVVEGDPREILTADVVSRVFGLGCRVIPDPETDTPLVVPLASPR